jgi:hypothetical protein
MKITEDILDELGFKKNYVDNGAYFYEYFISSADEWNPLYLVTLEISDETDGFWTVCFCDNEAIKWVDARRLHVFVRNLQEACETE